MGSKKAGKKGKKAAAARANGAAAKGPELRKPVDRNRRREKLPVAVGAEVVDRAAHEMARLHTDREALKSERRETMAEFKERMSGIDQRMTELADTVNKSTALTDVYVVDRLYVETNVVKVVREDTGEVVRERPATAEDRQEDLGLQEREARDLAPAALKGPGEVGARAGAGGELAADDEDEEADDDDPVVDDDYLGGGAGA